MIPSLQQFSRALMTPDLSFETLRDAEALTDGHGLPLLMRTTRFAEARIAWQGRQWLLSAPLSPAALISVERTASKIGRLNTDFLTEYRILPGELHLTDRTGAEGRCDLLLEHLPAGKTFEQALYSEPTSRLLEALDRLQAALRELGFAHNNLRTTNLHWTGGRIIPLRYHDARFGAPERDAEAFEALRELIRRKSDPMCVSDVEAEYNPLHRITGHLWTSHISEGLIVVEDESGYGYVDTDNNPVIESRFLWAGNFHEGRAEVQTPAGMGLIDRRGDFVIEPRYQIVDYRPAESLVLVQLDGLWASFDLLGRQLTEFGTNNEYI